MIRLCMRHGVHCVNLHVQLELTSCLLYKVGVEISKSKNNVKLCPNSHAEFSLLHWNYSSRAAHVWRYRLPWCERKTTPERKQNRAFGAELGSPKV